MLFVIQSRFGSDTYGMIRCKLRRLLRIRDKRSPALPTSIRVSWRTSFDRVILPRLREVFRNTDRDTTSNSAAMPSSKSALKSTISSTIAANVSMLDAGAWLLENWAATESNERNFVYRIVISRRFDKINPIGEGASSI